MIKTDIILELELAARSDPMSPAARLMMKAAQVIDAGRLMREGLSYDGRFPKVENQVSLKFGMDCWDSLMKG